jgi:hypothetical protein|eukprot:COSAG01_NODE_483_length_16412_cov_17.605162_1_plen_42_part_00
MMISDVETAADEVETPTASVEKVVEWQEQVHALTHEQLESS